jgi:hypothetical protein
MSMMQMAVSGYLDPAISLLKKTDGAHLYRPGVGWLDNLRAGNYTDSVGALPVVLDSPVGLTLDALSVLGSDQISNPDTGAMTPGGSTPPTFAATEYLGLPCRAITFNLSGSTSYASANAVAPIEGVFTAIGKTLEYSYELSLSRLLVEAENIQLYDQSTGVYTSNINAGASNSAIGVWKKINQIEKIQSDNPVRSTIAVYCSGNFTGGPLTAYIRAISVREITGIHASQSTTADKPKLTQRVNLLTETEFRNGLSDAPVKAGLLSVASMSGYLGAIAFGHDGETSTYTYKQQAHTNGVTYKLSVVVEMTDGMPPVISTTVGVNTLSLVMFGNAAPTDDPTIYTIIRLDSGAYLVQKTATSIGAVSIFFGVVKYSNTNNRTFKVTAYSLTTAANAHLPYQRVNTATDYDTFGFPPARWDFDTTDRLVLTLPAGYESATIIDATSAGPVTLLEQDVTGAYGIVGGLTDGPELVTNGTFDTDTGWTKGTGWTISGGSARSDGSAAFQGMSQTLTASAGKRYLVVISVTRTSGALILRLGSGANKGDISSSGVKIFTVNADGSALAIISSASGFEFVGSIDNISVREILPSTHGRIILRDTPTPRQLELCQHLANRLAGL